MNLGPALNLPSHYTVITMCQHVCNGSDMHCTVYLSEPVVFGEGLEEGFGGNCSQLPLHVTCHIQQLGTRDHTPFQNQQLHLDMHSNAPQVRLTWITQKLS